MRKRKTRFIDDIPWGVLGVWGKAKTGQGAKLAAYLAAGILAVTPVMDVMATEESAMEKSVVKSSAAEETTAKGFAAEESSAKSSSAEESSAKRFVAEESSAKRPVAEESNGKGSAAEESNAKSPVVASSVAEGSATEESAAEESSAREEIISVEDANETMASYNNEDTEWEEIYIGSVEDMKTFSRNCWLDTWSVNKKVYLTKDLDLSDSGFVSIPTFGGYFNGQGYTVSGLQIRDSISYTGLFCYTQESAVVANLTVKGNVRPSGKSMVVGGVVGDNSGIVIDCTFEGNVEGNDYVGGITGFNEPSGILIDCISKGKVTGVHYTGGIAGENTGNITGCANESDVNISNEDKVQSLKDINLEQYAVGLFDVESGDGKSKKASAINNTIDSGGIAGISTGIIQFCSNSGTVGYEHVGYNTGGIVGRQSGYVYSCENTGTVYGRKDVGGIVGQTEPYIAVDLSEDIAYQLSENIDKLHDLAGRMLEDAGAESDTVSARLTMIREFVDKALDDTYFLAGRTIEWTDGMIGSANDVMGRLDYIMDESGKNGGFLDQAKDAAGNVKNAAEELENTVAALDVYRYMTSEEREQYDAAKKFLEDASGQYRKDYAKVVEAYRNYYIDRIRSENPTYTGEGSSSGADGGTPSNSERPDGTGAGSSLGSNGGTPSPIEGPAGTEAGSSPDSDGGAPSPGEESNSTGAGSSSGSNGDAPSPVEGPAGTGAGSSPDSGGGTPSPSEGSDSTGVGSSSGSNGGTPSPVEGPAGTGAGSSPDSGGNTPSPVEGFNSTGAGSSPGSNGSTPSPGEESAVTRAGSSPNSGGISSPGVRLAVTGTGSSPGSGGTSSPGERPAGIGAGSSPGSNGSTPSPGEEPGATRVRSSQGPNVSTPSSDDTSSGTAAVSEQGLGTDSDSHITSDGHFRLYVETGVDSGSVPEQDAATGYATSSVNENNLRPRINGEADGGWVWDNTASYERYFNVEGWVHYDPASGVLADFPQSEGEWAELDRQLLRDVAGQMGADSFEIEKNAADYAEAQYGNAHPGSSGYGQDMENHLTAMADIVMKVSERMSEETRNKLQSAVGYARDASENLESAGGEAKSIFHTVNGMPDIQLPQLGSGYRSRAGSLNSNLQGLSENMGRLNDEMSSTNDVMLADLSEINDQFSKIMRLYTDAIDGVLDMDYSTVYEDNSQEDAETSTDATIADCTNNGTVRGDLNVSGIAGTMAVEYDFDLEGDVTGIDNARLNSTFLTKCVLRHNINEGSITAQKSYAGGISGLQEMGTILRCENYGRISSTAGNYVGGIAGKSLSYITNGYSKCTVSGEEYVAGIAGSGSSMADCCAMVRIQDASAFYGAIAGETDSSGTVTDNYFVSDEIAGIDRISYSGRAEPVSYEELLETEGLPNRFRMMWVTFYADGQEVKRVECPYGGNVLQEIYPDIPVKDGFYADWDIREIRNIMYDEDVTAEYVRYLTTLASEQTRGNGQSVLLVDGMFKQEARMEASEVKYAADNISLKNAAEFWRIEIPEDGNEEHRLRYQAPQGQTDGVGIYVKQDGEWRQADTELMGIYHLFTVEGAEAEIAVCVQEKAIADYLIYIIPTAAVLAILIVVIRRKKKLPKNGAEKI